MKLQYYIFRVFFPPRSVIRRREVTAKEGERDDTTRSKTQREEPKVIVVENLDHRHWVTDEDFHPQAYLSLKW